MDCDQSSKTKFYDQSKSDFINYYLIMIYKICTLLKNDKMESFGYII
jgi:hypothetical protein